MKKPTKFLYLFPQIFLGFLACILICSLLELIIEPFIHGFLYFYMGINCIVLMPLIPRLRLLFFIKNQTGIGITKKSMINISITISMLSFIYLPRLGGEWLNKLGKTSSITSINELNKLPKTHYVSIEPQLFKSLDAGHTQPIKYVRKYVWYTIFLPQQTNTIKPLWLPCISQSFFAEKPIDSTQQKIWKEEIKALETGNKPLYFALVNANYDKLKYFKDANSGKSSVFYEKIDTTPDEVVSTYTNKLGLMLGTVAIFYSLIILLLPTNETYADEILTRKIPWWNIWADRKSIST